MNETPSTLLATGTVRHLRLRPASHGFDYRTYFLLLPLRRLRAQPDAALARNRFGLIAFHDRDHGDGGDDCLAWLDAQLAAAGIGDAAGEVWLQTYPRVLGYVFKPVSFWYCHRADGSLAAIVAEVLGYGTTNDGHHMTAPHASGREAARAMRLAIDDAHLVPH